MKKKPQLELLQQTKKYKFNNILDIGLGDGIASKFFLNEGKKVYATSFCIETYGLDKDFLNKIKLYKDVEINDLSIFKNEKFDAVWCCNVIEHTQDMGKALSEIRRILKPNGILFIIYPPFYRQVVGGHVNGGGNIGLLMYNLLIAKFDIKNSSFIKHGSNVTGFVRKKEICLPPLRRDNGDINTLKSYFPMKVQENFNGNLKEVNWDWLYKKSLSSILYSLFIEQAYTIRECFRVNYLLFKENLKYLIKNLKK
jgi:SAM-dependent methyltransferase